MNEDLADVITRPCVVAGSVLLASMQPLVTTVTISPSLDLWRGNARLSSLRPAVIGSQPGEGVTFDLPVTDQPGHRLHPLAEVIDVTDGKHTHHYRATITTATEDGRIVDQRAVAFVLPTGDPSPVSLDEAPPWDRATVARWE